MSFARQGIIVTGTSDVASAAGMKVGSLYFPPKDAPVRQGIGPALAYARRRVALQREFDAPPGPISGAAIEVHVVAPRKLGDHAVVVACVVAGREQAAREPLPPALDYARYRTGLISEIQSRRPEEIARAPAVLIDVHEDFAEAPAVKAGVGHDDAASMKHSPIENVRGDQRGDAWTV